MELMRDNLNKINSVPRLKVIYVMHNVEAVALNTLYVVPPMVRLLRLH